MKRFLNKRIVVTGGTSGIGLVGARRLAEEGAEVFVTGRKDPIDPLPAGVRFVRNDAADPDCGQQLLKALPPGIRLDGLWLNAGYARVLAIDEVDAAFFDQMTNANVRGPTLQLAALCSRLEDRASVLVTSSTSTYEGSPMASIYAATKGALVSLCRCWASALAARSIRANVLVPGAIGTGFRDFMPEEFRAKFEADVAGRTVLRRVGSPEEAASVTFCSCCATMPPT